MARQPPEGWQTAQPMEWQRLIRPVDLTPGGMAVALALASFANAADGKNAHPGLSRLQWVTGASRHTVTATLANLEAMWLIFCHERSKGGGHATVWWLTKHDEIECHGLSFDAWEKARRPVDNSARATDEGFPGRPFTAMKGSGTTREGFRNGR